MQNELSETDTNIFFHSEEIDFLLQEPQKISSWIASTIAKENHSLEYVNFIFCSDKYLHKINLDYLEHDTLTDIITFPYAEDKVEADIFISIERVKENSGLFNVSFENELHRVIIHGILHLLGYKDKSEIDQKEMRSKENYYLSVLKKL